MMEMGQQLYNDAGGGGALPPSSSNSNSLQFSPQSALTSNENLFLLDDPDFSTYSTDAPMEPFHIPSFSAQMGADFSSVFMDQYSANLQGNSGFLEGFHQVSPVRLPSSNGGFYAPADEWSGTSTNSMQEGGHGNLNNITSVNSQVHSLTNPSFITGTNQSMTLDGRNPSPQIPFDNDLQSAQDGVDRHQSLINRGLNQGGSDQMIIIGKQGHLDPSQEGSSLLASQGINPSQGGSSLMASQGVNSSQGASILMTSQRINSSQGGSSPVVSQGMVNPGQGEVNPSQGISVQKVNSSQGGVTLLTSQAGQPRVRNHELQNLELLQQGNVDIPPMLFNQQQSHTDQVSISNSIPSNNNILSYPPETIRVSTSGFEPRTRNQLGTILGNSLTRAGMMQNILQGQQQGPSAMKSSVSKQGGEGDSSGIQTSYQDANALFQPGIGESSVTKLAGNNQFGQLNNGQHQQNDVQQSLMNSSFQMQGRHLLSQSPAQLESISQGQGQGQGQGQVQVQSAFPQAASPNQQAARYQSRQLPGGILNSNQQASFHSIQPPGNLNPSPSPSPSPNSNPNPNLHLNGTQQPMIPQIPRLLNPMLQGLKFGAPQRSPLGFGNGVDGNARTQMPPPIAARCIQVLMHYIQEQQKKPPDNDIAFWRNLVKEFFVPGATKRWCLSSYNSSPMGRHAQGLFPMDYWFCNICGVYPGRGFESSTDVLPRLFKIKYASGLLNELLFLDVAEKRYMLPNGRLVLEFPRAVHESIFPELRVVRYGRLRVTFSSSFKIYSWEFCTKIHEEVVSRKGLLQQAQQLAKLVMDCNQEGFDKSIGTLKTHCHEVTAIAKQLESKLEAPSVNDLGFSKRYVRCLQIAEVVNSMKDLISFERKTGLGPVASLSNFPTKRKLPDELLARSTVNQIMTQLTQGNMNSNNHRQGLINESHLHQNQPTITTISTNAIIPDVKMEQSNGVFRQMQPFGQQMQSFGQQIQPFGQQIQPSQALVQPVNFNHIPQQLYESAVGNRQLPHPTQSQSLHQTGPQSLPGTPQSEMSDMRTNA